MPNSFQLANVVPGLPDEKEGDGVWLLQWPTGLANVMKRVNGIWHYGDGWPAREGVIHEVGHLPGKLPEAVTFADVPRPRQIRVRWREVVSRYKGMQQAGETVWLTAARQGGWIDPYGGTLSTDCVRQWADIDPATPIEEATA